MGYLGEAKAALSLVRKTGKFLGRQIDTSDFKDYVRGFHTDYGTDATRQLLTQQPGKATERWLWGQPSSFPVNKNKLPKNSFNVNTPIPVSKAKPNPGLMPNRGRPAPAKAMTDAQKKAMIARKRNASGTKEGV
jgi:hypothetical protein